MKSILVLSLIIAPLGIFADEVTVKVDGMVCSFCSQGLTKAFKAESGVDSVEVDLDKKIVALKTKSSSPTDERIRQIVIDSGFKVQGIERRS